jgi:hypothetical protein
MFTSSLQALGLDLHVGIATSSLIKCQLMGLPDDGRGAGLRGLHARALQQSNAAKLWPIAAATGVHRTLEGELSRWERRSLPETTRMCPSACLVLL